MCTHEHTHISPFPLKSCLIWSSENEQNNSPSWRNEIWDEEQLGNTDFIVICLELMEKMLTCCSSELLEHFTITLCTDALTSVPEAEKGDHRHHSSLQSLRQKEAENYFLFQQCSPDCKLICSKILDKLFSEPNMKTQSRFFSCIPRKGYQNTITYIIDMSVSEWQQQPVLW